MAINNDINIRLNAKDKASKSFDKLSKSSKWLSWKLKWLSGPLKKISIWLWAVWAVTWVVGVKMFNMADDIEQTMGKSKIVFGEYFDDMDKLAKTTAKSLWLSRNEYLKTASGIQDLLIPMWFTREEATKQTTKMVELSGALAEWSNGQYNASEAGSILAKAMLWETEQLKTMGIAIDQSSKEFNARIALMAEDTWMTLQQAKAMDIQTQIMEKSTDAQKAFADGSDSLTRKKAELTATLKNTQETIARALIPAFHNIINSLTPMIEKISESVKLWFENKQNVEKLTKTLSTIWKVFMTMAKIVWWVIKVFYKLWESLGLIAFKIIETTEKVKNFVKEAKQWWSNLVTMFIEWITAKVKALKDKVVGIATTISDYLWFHSPTKKGPASDSDKWMPNFVNMLSKGLQEWKAKVSRSAMELSTSLSSAFGAWFWLEKIQTLLDTFEWKFQTSLSNIDSKISDTKNNISWLKSEIEGLNNSLSSLEDKKSANKQTTKWNLAKRALDIEEQLKDKTIEYFKKKELLAELQIAKQEAWEKALSEAREYSQLNESEKIIKMWEERKKAINDEIRDVKTAIAQKMSLLKEEEDALTSMHDKKVEFENQYHQLFQKNSSERLLSIQESITAMQRLNSIKSSSVSWTKANWWNVNAGESYRVWERGAEMFVPNTSGTIIPTDKMNTWNTISIWNISLPNVSNSTDFVRELENMARLQSIWIT